MAYEITQTDPVDGTSVSASGCTLEEAEQALQVKLELPEMDPETGEVL